MRIPFIALAVVAALIAHATHAADVAALPNRSGGEIVLTDTQCTPTSLLAYTYTESGDTATGCWTLRGAGSRVAIAWDGGRVNVYPTDDFDPIHTYGDDYDD